MLYASPRWMLAVTPAGLIGLGPSTEIEVEFDARQPEKQRLLEVLGSGANAAAVAGIVDVERTEAEQLLARLEGAGVLTQTPPEPPPVRGIALISALLRLDDGGGLGDLVWTADEALLVPAGLDESKQRKLLRAFIAGIEPRERRAAYGYAARWKTATVWGDIPDPERLAAALEATRLDPAAIGVVRLDGSARVSLDPAALAHLGVDRTHRLGPVTSISRMQLAREPAELHLASARIATPNLAYPEPPVVGFSGKGTGPSPGVAETIARGEAAERYATGDVSGHRIVRASEGELQGAVPGDRLFRRNTRQYEESAIPLPYDPKQRYLWTPADGRNGAQRWVLAEAVFNPLHDFELPGPVVVATSSGAAAHRTLAEARRRAFCELVERDAFMWTWVQRISRERIARDSLPEELQARVAQLGRAGYEADCANLTLETKPVILCVVRDEALLVVGACCEDDPARAAAKALDEATLVLSLARQSESVPADDVRTPYDHVRLYRDPAVVQEASFLHSSEEEIELAEVRGADGSVEALLADIGEPLTVDLSSPATRPLRVVRALVPGLLPISFGWDQEPLGMPLLATSRIAADGRRLGSDLDLAAAGPLMPHPFA